MRVRDTAVLVAGTGAPVLAALIGGIVFAPTPGSFARPAALIAGTVGALACTGALLLVARAPGRPGSAGTATVPGPASAGAAPDAARTVPPAAGADGVPDSERRTCGTALAGPVPRPAPPREGDGVRVHTHFTATGGYVSHNGVLLWATAQTHPHTEFTPGTRCVVRRTPGPDGMGALAVVLVTRPSTTNGVTS